MKNRKIHDILYKVGDMMNYIILHGSFGSKDGNWFPWLKKQLENKNYKVDVPQMPVGVGNQNYDDFKCTNPLPVLALSGYDESIKVRSKIFNERI